jgi:hypothetical protein
LRTLRALCRKGKVRQFNVHLAPEVARLLVEEEKTSLEHLENSFGTKINIIANSAFIIDNFDVKAVQ